MVSASWAILSRQHSKSTYADVAQLVAHHLAKVRVAGSSPVFRSIFLPGICSGLLLDDARCPFV